MRQEINLYSREFRRRDQPLSGKQVVRLAAGFFLLLLLVEAAVGWRWYVNTEQLAALKVQEATVSQRLTRLKQSQPLSQRPRLETQIAELQQQIRRREELRSIISGRDLGNSDGFAHYLEAMARQTLPDVALTQIRLLRGGSYVEFDGHTRKAEAVPEYLDRLRSEESFNAVKFGVLSILRPEESRGYWQFKLSSPNKDADGSLRDQAS